MRASGCWGGTCWRWLVAVAPSLNIQRVRPVCSQKLRLHCSQCKTQKNMPALWSGLSWCSLTCSRCFLLGASFWSTHHGPRTFPSIILTPMVIKMAFKVQFHVGAGYCGDVWSSDLHQGIIFPCIPEVWASIDRLVNVSTTSQYALYMTFCMLKLQDWTPSGQRAFEVSIHVKFMSSTWMNLASWRASFKSGHHFVR